MDISNDGRVYHLNCEKKDIGRYAILPGDPGRCGQIAAYLDSTVHVGSNREFNIYTGSLLGERVTVCSTGIGGPSAAIAMEELIQLGADTFIRVGTCGGIALQVESGDNCIAMSAVRMGGTADEYAPLEYPATSDFAVLTALVQAAEALHTRYHVGVIQSKDSFYGQHSPDSMPVGDILKSKWEAYKRLGVLASEMETDTLFTVAAARGVRAGAVYHVVWNQERAAKGLPMTRNDTNADSIRVGVEAMKLLIENDRKNEL